MRFFRLQADLGVLTKYENEQSFNDIQSQHIDILSMPKKSRDKRKVEVIFLNKIVSLNHSFRDEFTKQKNQHCLELYYENDMILYLACYDGDQLKQWMQYIKKAMQFHEWLTNLKSFLE